MRPAPTIRVLKPVVHLWMGLSRFDLRKNGSSKYGDCIKLQDPKPFPAEHPDRYNDGNKSTKIRSDCGSGHQILFLQLAAP